MQNEDTSNAMQESKTERLFNMSGAARYTGKPIMEISELVSKNELKSRVFNGKMVFAKAELDNLIKRQKEVSL